MYNSPYQGYNWIETIGTSEPFNVVNPTIHHPVNPSWLGVIKNNPMGDGSWKHIPPFYIYYHGTIVSHPILVLPKVFRIMINIYNTWCRLYHMYYIIIMYYIYIILLHRNLEDNIYIYNIMICLVHLFFSISTFRRAQGGRDELGHRHRRKFLRWVDERSAAMNGAPPWTIQKIVKSKWCLPSGYIKIAIENGPFIVDLPIKGWWFSIAMLVYQRVCQNG